MFQLLKTPVAIAVSLLVSQSVFADDDKDKFIKEALLSNAASYLDLPVESNKTNDIPPLKSKNDVVTETESSVIQDDSTTIHTPSSTDEKSTYPLGLSKEQYIARLKVLESKRSTTSSLNSFDAKAQHDAVDKLIARLRVEQAKKEKQTSSAPERIAPERKIKVEKKDENPSSTSYFEQWFGSNKTKAKNSLKEGE